MIRAGSWDYGTYHMCDQWRLRRACASAKSRQSLRCSLTWSTKVDEESNQKSVLCPWARHFTPRKYWLITQEAMAPSRHDWKIVDWDVKPQHNQPTKNQTFSPTGWLRMRVWRMSLRMTKSTIISWDGSFDVLTGARKCTRILKIKQIAMSYLMHVTAKLFFFNIRCTYW